MPEFNNEYDVKMEFSDLLYKDKNLYENIFKYICNLSINLDINVFFEDGFNFLDQLLESKVFKNLSVNEQLEILKVLNGYKARYSDNVYIEALWYPVEIQEFVKENFPREYSKRHIVDVENY